MGERRKDAFRVNFDPKLNSILSRIKGAKKVLMTARTFSRLKMVYERLGSIDSIIVSNNENLKTAVKLIRFRKVLRSLKTKSV